MPQRRIIRLNPLISIKLLPASETEGTKAVQGIIHPIIIL